MSERMAAEIWIGGTVPANLVDELCGEIDAAGVALEWGGGRFAPKTEEELLQARVDRNGAAVLYLCDEQAAWERFDALEGFLQEHGIPFTRRDDGGAAYNGEIVECRPGNDVVCIPIDADGAPVVDASALCPVDEALSSTLEYLCNGSVGNAVLSLKQAQQLLREQLPPTVSPLEPFEINN